MKRFANGVALAQIVFRQHGLMRIRTNKSYGQNRRMVIESRAGVPPVARRREQWTHLPDGRWIERIVSTNNGTAYYPPFTNRYVWDGQVLLAVLDDANNLVVSFLRGLDLSGTLEGAGGVGGLLAVHDSSTLNNQPSTHFVCYDGNGNVTALVNAEDGTETARYEYGPFGEPLRMTGPMAKLNPIRFSTQYADEVTGDLKYLFRDYDADMGRWLNRDPFGERESSNDYAFCKNDSGQFFEPDGKSAHTVADTSATSQSQTDEPTDSQCSKFPWWGQILGITFCNCKSSLTAAGRQMPKFLQDCTLRHEGVHVAYCKRFGRFGCTICALFKNPRACNEQRAYVESTKCAREQMGNISKLSPEDQLALKCYLKASIRSCKANKAVCDKWANKDGSPSCD
jgi:RHS repeat-associated protein